MSNGQYHVFYLYFLLCVIYYQINWILEYNKYITGSIHESFSQEALTEEVSFILNAGGINPWSGYRTEHGDN